MYTKKFTLSWKMDMSTISDPMPFAASGSYYQYCTSGTGGAVRIHSATTHTDTKKLFLTKKLSPFLIKNILQK